MSFSPQNSNFLTLKLATSWQILIRLLGYVAGEWCSCPPASRCDITCKVWICNNSIYYYYGSIVGFPSIQSMETVYTWSPQPTMWIGFLNMCVWCGVCVCVCTCSHTQTQSLYPNNTINVTLCGGATCGMRVQSLSSTIHNTFITVWSQTPGVTSAPPPSPTPAPGTQRHHRTT